MQFGVMRRCSGRSAHGTAPPGDGTCCWVLRCWLVLYVNASVATRPEVADFVTEVLQVGAALSSEPIFLPLQSEQYQQALSKFQAQRFGPMSPRGASQSATGADILEGIPKPVPKPASPTR
jgi:hypothetical protein